jgi:enoyl-CoA hydratase/carnithine racemase
LGSLKSEVDAVEFEFKKEGKIAIFRLNRPKALNALSPTLFREMHDALEDFRSDFLRGGGYQDVASFCKTDKE